MDIISQHQCFGGTLTYRKHAAQSTRCDMRFSVFLPPQAATRKCATLFYLSGLTCTEENFTIKAGAYRMAAELGLIVVAPDTSPRGDTVANGDDWTIGKGAGYYIDATETPWAQHYQMETYITQELYVLVLKEFPADAKRIGIFGHSMGGHGALTLYLRHPNLYRSVSAFAPICAPSQSAGGQKVFAAYLGGNQKLWAEHDATELMRAKGKVIGRPPILIDQGMADEFLLKGGLNPDFFEAACAEAGQKLILRRHVGYDHGYFFIQTFIDDHLRHHAGLLES
jgi:S-formylglutathione hydrolase